jgi:hypothetical protein
MSRGALVSIETTFKTMDYVHRSVRKLLANHHPKTLLKVQNLAELARRIGRREGEQSASEKVVGAYRAGRAVSVKTLAD